MNARRRTVLLVLTTLLAVILLSPRPAYAGYTHYWMWHARPGADALRACVADMDRIVEMRRGSLADRQDRTGTAAVFLGSGTFEDAGAPGPDIMFDGIGEDGYETFGFPLAPFMADRPEFQFVKTAAKPYDEVVTACLIVARDHFRPEVLTIASDGTWLPDWVAGAALYEKALGRTATDPLGGSMDLPGDGQPQAGAAVPPGDSRSMRKNLLVSALIFLALAIAYLLVRART
jgi:hypothetical protein